MTPSRASAGVRAQVRGAFGGVKVFSATTVSGRNALGDQVTQWLAEHPELQVADFVVVQSSDARFHCLSICVFYQRAAPRPERP